MSHGARVCPSCGVEVADEADHPALNLLAGAASARAAMGERAPNLERILAALCGLEQGTTMVEDALRVLDSILGTFRRWYADICRVNESDLWNAEEVQMHREYHPLCERMLQRLEKYRLTLQAGDLAQARMQIIPLEEDFSLLTDLSDHYASLGW